MAEIMLARMKYEDHRTRRISQFYVRSIMIPAVVKNEKQYKECLDRIDYLMQSDPEPDSEPGQELEILAALVEDYESNRFKFSLPGVIDAVLFRMKETCL